DPSLINTTLAALGGVVYHGDLNFNGNDQLTVSTTDEIILGVGGTGTPGPLTDTDLVGITVNAVNDEPVGTDKAVVIAEDTPYTFTAADFGFSDPADGNPPSNSGANAFQDVVITSLPGTGTLRLGANLVVAGQAIAVADIPNLVFTP